MDSQQTFELGYELAEAVFAMEIAGDRERDLDSPLAERVRSLKELATTIFHLDLENL